MPSSVHSFVRLVPEMLQRGILSILPDNQNLVVAKTSTSSNMVRKLKLQVAKSA